MEGWPRLGISPRDVTKPPNRSHCRFGRVILPGRRLLLPILAHHVDFIECKNKIDADSHVCLTSRVAHVYAVISLNIAKRFQFLTRQFRGALIDYNAGCTCK